jgi:hypothetical protein
MSLIQKFIAAMVLLTGLILLTVPQAAAHETSKLTVRVVDTIGTPIEGEEVTIYQGNTGACRCAGNPSLCDEAPLVTPAPLTDKHGKVEFENLMRGTTYTVCIDAQCFDIRNPCGNPQTDCQFAGTCMQVTPRRGHENIQFIHQ